jgi:hypothetical protein
MVIFTARANPPLAEPSLSFPLLSYVGIGLVSLIALRGSYKEKKRRISKPSVFVTFLGEYHGNLDISDQERSLLLPDRKGNQ